MFGADILFTATREPSYVRNLLVRRALARIGRLTEVTSSLPSYPLRIGSVAAGLILCRPPADVIWAGFFGQPLVPLIKKLYPDRPLILDAFVSAFDTLCLDRQSVRPASPLGRLAHLLDRAALTRADVVVADTAAQAAFLAAEFGLDPGRVVVHRLGYDDEVFKPVPPGSGPGVRVFFYGSFLPLHGVDVILEAARRLAGEPRIRFVIGGAPPGRRNISSRDVPANVQPVGYIPYHRLPEYIAAADICLAGPFGTTPKASRVITGKTYQFLACGRATIVGDNDANRELFIHARDVWFVPRGDPEGLAAAIRLLGNDPALRNALAEGGRRRAQEFSPAEQVRQLRRLLELVG